VEQALGISPERTRQLRVVPLVVLNQGFGISYEIECCRLTDARFLALFLESGTYTPSALISPSDGSFALAEAKFYSNRHEASSRFEAIFRNPPPLSRFLDRLTWTYFPFPTACGEPLHCATTVLQDIPEAERQSAKRIARLVGMI
jgi:hypothetical protein